MKPEAQRYSHVTRAMSETPWAILEDTFLAIAEAISLRARGLALADDELQARIGSGPARRDAARVGAIAVLPIYGTIFPRANLVTEMSGGTSLELLGRTIDAVAADEDVSAIVLDVHSPGGSTFLVSETAAKIRAARDQKPVVAVVNALAASAAYHLASQATEIVASPSSIAGSIGVFAVHQDFSRQEDMLGISTTLVHAGKFKTEGNEHEPLSDDARQAMQLVVDELYSSFVADVAKGRGVSRAKVENGYGEGRVLAARQALAEGMVDRIDTLENTLARLRSPRGLTRAGARSELEPRAEEPDEPENDLEEPETEEIPEEALAGLRAMRSDMREQTQLSRTTKALRELATEMRTRTPRGDD